MWELLHFVDPVTCEVRTLKGVDDAGTHKELLEYPFDVVCRGDRAERVGT